MGLLDVNPAVWAASNYWRVVPGAVTVADAFAVVVNEGRRRAVAPAGVEPAR